MFKSNDLKFLIIMKILKNCNGFWFGHASSKKNDYLFIK